jgi:YegS/Rv2252/BmrU family lipid kinase
MARRIALIVNPHAGGGRAAAALPLVEAALSARGVSWHVEPTRSLEHARGLARAARDAGEVAVTLSGDGLIGAVAGELHGTEGVLGVLPGGRGNDFARVLGISRDPAEACDTIATGVERVVDVGDVDGRPFIGVASCGFDSDANRIANETTLVKGNLVYAYGALRAMWEWKPAHFQLDVDGRERVTFTGYSVACANSRAYGGGMFIAPEAELDDGRLDVVMSGRVGKLRALYDLPKVFTGAHARLPHVRIVRAGEVRVSADRPFTMYADGDPIAELPATVRVHQRSLRVLVPA